MRKMTRVASTGALATAFVLGLALSAGAEGNCSGAGYVVQTSQPSQTLADSSTATTVIKSEKGS